MAAADSGADILELGIPFSDPLADGPVIQRVSHEALRSGVTVGAVLSTLQEFRAVRDTPVVLFGYLNPILQYGVDAFISDATAAGAQGLLITDLPAGCDPSVEGPLAASTLDLIRLVAPTTPADRVREIAGDAGGFLYYVSRTGVTGARTDLRGDLEREVRALKGLVSLPVAVGFGISTPEQAASVAAVADGVVVGSALLGRIEHEGIEGGARFLGALRAAMDARSPPGRC